VLVATDGGVASTDAVLHAVHVVDVVVLGTRRRPGEYRGLLGATAERAARPAFVAKTTG